MTHTVVITRSTGYASCDNFVGVTQCHMDGLTPKEIARATKVVVGRYPGFDLLTWCCKESVGGK